MSQHENPGGFVERPSQPASSAAVHSLSHFVRRGAVIIVLFAVVGALVADWVTSRMQKQYTATASVLVTPTGVGDSGNQTNGRTSGSINLDTEAQLVESSAVATQAATIDKALVGLSATDRGTNLSVSVPANTTVLDIAYTDTTAAGAQAAANAFAQAYLNDRLNTAKSLLNSQIASVASQVNALTAKLKALPSTTVTPGKPQQINTFPDSQRTLYTSQISALNQRLVNLQTTAVTPGRVLSAASLPTKPSSPSRLLNVGSGLAAGLVLGLFLAWLRASHPRRARGAMDIARATDLPVAAVLPAPDGTAAPSEAHRRLATLVASTIGERGSIVLAPAAASPQAPYVAAQLAAALAAHGTSVCLLRVADQPIDLELPAGVTVTTLPRAESVRLLNTDADTMKAALARIQGSATYLVIDAPAPARKADAATLATAADAVILTLVRGTRLSAVRSAMAQLDAVAAPMLGVAIVRHRRLAALGSVVLRRTEAPAAPAPAAEEPVDETPHADAPEPAEAETDAPAKKERALQYASDSTK